MNKFLFAIFAALALAACGGSAGTEAQSTPSPSTPDAGPHAAPPSISDFTADPASLPIGGGQVTLQWSVDGATRVTIDQGIGDVSGESSVKTTVTSSTTFTLTATNEGGSVTRSTSVSVAQPVTVSGQVVDARGKPAASATVVIGELPAAITGADGRFRIEGVSPPFNAAVIGANQQNIVLYEGLTATDLTLTLLAQAQDVSSANLYGAVSGGAGPYQDSNAPFVGFASAEVDATGATTELDGSFGFAASWPSGGSTTGTLFALQPTRDGNGIATGWQSFGRKDGVTLNAGSDLSGLSVTLSPVSSSTLAGAVQLPQDYLADEEDVMLELNPAGTLVLMQNTSGSTAFGFNVPMIPQSSYAVVALAHPQNSVNSAASLAVVTGVQPGDNSVALTVAPVPNLGTPLDQANAVDRDTPFVWSGIGTGGVYDLRAVRGDGRTLQIDVITTSTQTKLPDLSRLGVALPASTPFYWYVYGLAPFSSLDEAATTTELGSLFAFRRQGTIANSDFREFTTR